MPAADDPNVIRKNVNNRTKYFVETKVPITTIPFVKSHEFNYSKLLPASWQRLYMDSLYTDCDIYYHCSIQWCKYTDGLDGLATGTSALIGVCLGIFAYASGNYFCRISQHHVHPESG